MSDATEATVEAHPAASSPSVVADSVGGVPTEASASAGTPAAGTVDAAADSDEGDLAADYLEELLDRADLDGDIDIVVRGGRVYLSIEADEPDSLRTLSKPDTVSALQELTRLAVHVRTGEFSRLILDIAGSRDARAEELQRLVDRAVERIDGGAASAALPPMSSYERKLVHDLVGERGFTSESEGEGAERHTVIRRG
jgi:spoIIIJ-associated protein